MGYRAMDTIMDIVSVVSSLYTLCLEVSEESTYYLHIEYMYRSIYRIICFRDMELLEKVDDRFPKPRHRLQNIGIITKQRIMW